MSNETFIVAVWDIKKNLSFLFFFLLKILINSIIFFEIELILLPLFTVVICSILKFFDRLRKSWNISFWYSEYFLSGVNKIILLFGNFSNMQFIKLN